MLPGILCTVYYFAFVGILCTVYYFAFVCSYFMMTDLAAPANFQFTTAFYAHGDPTVDPAADFARKAVRKVDIARATFIYSHLTQTLSLLLLRTHQSYLNSQRHTTSHKSDISSAILDIEHMLRLLTRLSSRGCQEVAPVSLRGLNIFLRMNHTTETFTLLIPSLYSFSPLLSRLLSPSLTPSLSISPSTAATQFDATVIPEQNFYDNGHEGYYMKNPVY
jgi:hypothetical protein